MRYGSSIQDSLEAGNAAQGSVQPEEGRALNDELLRQSPSLALQGLGRDHDRLQDLEQTIPEWGERTLETETDVSKQKIRLQQT